MPHDVEHAIASLRTSDLHRPAVRSALAYLIARITRGPGHAAPELRQAAMTGRTSGPLGTYLDRVREAPTSITDEEVRALQAGHSDDVLFELTVATALGAAVERLRAGLAVLDAAAVTDGTPGPNDRVEDG